jgi:hypothetical protein
VEAASAHLIADPCSASEKQISASSLMMQICSLVAPHQARSECRSPFAVGGDRGHGCYGGGDGDGGDSAATVAAEATKTAAATAAAPPTATEATAAVTVATAEAEAETTAEAKVAAATV